MGDSRFGCPAKRSEALACCVADAAFGFAQGRLRPPPLTVLFCKCRIFRALPSRVKQISLISNQRCAAAANLLR
ncbi:MAG: hypothetical protein DMG76_02995 [Acidobacteria bacterium]|nr:MAG: hypothetical protein DMG76_02995 [Acidobacteriota bacterium]